LRSFPKQSFKDEDLFNWIYSLKNNDCWHKGYLTGLFSEITLMLGFMPLKKPMGQKYAAFKQWVVYV